MWPGRPWTSQEPENLSSRPHLVLYPISLPPRRESCPNGDSPAKQKSEKPVGQLCGFLKQVRQEWPRLGRLLASLGQKGCLCVLEKANLISLNPVFHICAPGHPTSLCALLAQKAAPISSGGFTEPACICVPRVFFVRSLRVAQQMTCCQKLGFLKSRAKASCVTQPACWLGELWQPGSRAAPQASPSITASAPLLVLREMNAETQPQRSPGPSARERLSNGSTVSPQHLEQR